MDSHDELYDLYKKLEARVSALEERQPATPTTGPSVQGGDPKDVIHEQVTNKRFDAGDYQNHIWFDCMFIARELSRPTRAVKGTLEFCDLLVSPTYVSATR